MVTRMQMSRPRFANVFVTLMVLLGLNMVRLWFAAPHVAATSQASPTYIVQAGKSFGVSTLTAPDPQFNSALDSFTQHARSRLPNIEAVKPYMLIVRNDSSQRIMRLSVRHDIAYANRPSIVWTQTLVRGDGVPLLEPGQSALAFQGIVDLGFGAAAGTQNEIDQLASLLATANEVVVTLDLVVFESGMMVGPDRNGASVQYRAEQQAVRDLLDELRRIKLEGTKAALESWAALSPTRSLPLPDAMRDFAFNYQMKQRNVSRFLVHRKFDLDQCIDYLTSVISAMKDLNVGPQ